MIEQIRTLAGFIDEYSGNVSNWVTRSPELRERILESIDQVWQILWQDGVSIGMILDTLEKWEWAKDMMYREKMLILNASVMRWKHIKEWIPPEKAERILREAKLDFMRWMLDFFGIPNVELFIVRGSLWAIENPIVRTKIRAEVLLREQRKWEKAIGKAEWPDLEGFDTIISWYEATYSTLVDRQRALDNIINEEIIAPLAETFPFPATEPVRSIIDYSRARAERIKHIEKAQRHLQHLETLAEWNTGKWLKALIKKALARVDTEQSKLSHLHEKFFWTVFSWNLGEMHDAVIRSFGITPPKKKIKLSEPLMNIPIEKILETLRGAISVVVFARYSELQKLRENERKIVEILKKFKIILEKYRPEFEETLQDQEKKSLIARFRKELEDWDSESNALIEEYSLKNIRSLRNTIIEDLTIPYLS